LRIAHIVRRYSAAEWGGTETVVQHTVEEQVRRGHEPIVFATNALQPSGAELLPHTRTFGYSYPYWPMSPKDRLALDKKGGSPYAPALFRAVRVFRPDLIHIHAGGRLATASVVTAERLGVPSVMSLHGGAAVVPQCEIDEMLRPLKGKFPYGGILDRLFGLHFDPLSRVGAIVCISHGEERHLRERYPHARIRYVPNGVAPTSRVIRPAQSDAVRNVLCVSRIDYQKNQVALVEALANLPENFRLTLIGPVTADWYRNKIVARVQELGLGNRVRIVPGLPPGSDELEAEFAQADVFVLPSLHEPFGIVALEAMQRGIPLVAAKVGGLTDLVIDGVNGFLFNPSDTGALSAAIVRICDDAALTARLATAGFEIAAQYLWSQVITTLDGVYNELLGKGAGA